MTVRLHCVFLLLMHDHIMCVYNCIEVINDIYIVIPFGKELASGEHTYSDTANVSEGR